MATEKLTAQIIVETDQKSLKQSEQEIERLRSPEAIKMAVDLWQLRQQLNVVKKALAEALKVWDSDLAKKMWGDLEILKKQITQANRELTNFVRTGDKEVSVLWKLFRQVGIDIDSWIGKALVGASEQMAQFGSNALSFLGAGAIAWGMAYLAKQSLFLADKLEQTSISFEVLTGSGEKAKKLLWDLTQLAKESPTLELLSIRDTAKQLIAFGIDTDSVVGTIKMLGDVSAATGVDISRIGYAYGQVRSAGRLYGTELRQFTEAGVPLLATLANMYGVTEKSARKMVEDGKVSFNDMQEAFRKLTSEWWMMANMMSRQANTLSGKISKLKDEIAISMEEWGGAIMDFAKTGVDWTTWLFLRLKDAFAWMQMIMTIFTWFFIDSILAIRQNTAWLGAFFQKFGVLWTAIWQQFGDNLSVFVQNVGIAFDNMPSYIQGWLQKSLDVMNVFFQSAEQALIDLGTLFGKEWKLAKWLDIKLDFAWPKKEYIAFSDDIIWGAYDRIQAISKETTDFKANMQEMRDINKVVAKEMLTDIANKNWAEAQSQAKLNYELKKMAEEQEKDDTKNKKKWTDIAKKAEEERKKIQKESIEFQKKVFENAKKLREDDIKNTEEYIAKLSKALQEINDIENEIAWVESESWEKILGEAGSRYRELLEWQKKLKEDLIAAQNETAWTAYLPDPTIQKNLDETIKQIKELEESWLLDQNTKAKEQQRASLSGTEQERFDFQDKLWQIAIDKANEKARLEEEKTKIENDLKMKKDQIQKELIIAENRKASNEIAINKYKDMIALVEKGITDNTQKEIDRRMSLYAQEEQRLLRLIELRMQAGYAVGAIAPQPVSNTSNTTVNQVVNATVNNKVDQDALARDLANRVVLANKWISK